MESNGPTTPDFCARKVGMTPLSWRFGAGRRQTAGASSSARYPTGEGGLGRDPRRQWTGRQTEIPDGPAGRAESMVEEMKGVGLRPLLLLHQRQIDYSPDGRSTRAEGRSSPAQLSTCSRSVWFSSDAAFEIDGSDTEPPTSSRMPACVIKQHRLPRLRSWIAGSPRLNRRGRRA